MFGDIDTGRDHYCSLGIGTPTGAACMPGFGQGATLDGAGAKIELVFTYESDDAPADSDARPDFAIHIGSFDWIDLTVRLFDADSSVVLAQDSIVTEPDRESGQINIADQAVSSFFIASSSIDDLSATDPTDAQVRAEFSLAAAGLLSGTSLAPVFQWDAAVDSGSGTGRFTVEQCDTSTPGCAFLASGTFHVTSATATIVPEPGTGLLVALGLCVLSVRRRRPTT